MSHFSGIAPTAYKPTKGKKKLPENWQIVFGQCCELVLPQYFLSKKDIVSVHKFLFCFPCGMYVYLFSRALKMVTLSALLYK